MVALGINAIHMVSLCSIFDVAKDINNKSENEIIKKSKNCTLKVSSSYIEFFNSSEELKKQIQDALLQTSDEELKTYLLKRKKRVSSNKTIVRAKKRCKSN